MRKKSKIRAKLEARPLTVYLKCECGHVTASNVIVLSPLKPRRRLDCQCIDTTTTALNADEAFDALARQEIEAA